MQALPVVSKDCRHEPGALLAQQRRDQEVTAGENLPIALGDLAPALLAGQRVEVGKATHGTEPAVAVQAIAPQDGHVALALNLRQLLLSLEMPVPLLTAREPSHDRRKIGTVPRELWRIDRNCFSRALIYLRLRT